MTQITELPSMESDSKWSLFAQTIRNVSYKDLSFMQWVVDTLESYFSEN
jgi:hypothetical protein